MNGDTLPSGTASVTLTDSQGGSHTDADQLAGDAAGDHHLPGGRRPGRVLHDHLLLGLGRRSPTMNPSRGLPGPHRQHDRAGRDVDPHGADRRRRDQHLARTPRPTTPTTPRTSDADFGLLDVRLQPHRPGEHRLRLVHPDQYAPANTSENLVGLVSYTETDQVACSGYTAGHRRLGPGRAQHPRSARQRRPPSQVARATETFYDDTDASPPRSRRPPRRPPGT